MTVAPMAENKVRDDVGIVEVCRELRQRGADVVGMNCFRGPATIMPYIREIRHAVDGHVAALPVPYRTTEQQPTFFNLEDDKGCACPSPHGRAFPPPSIRSTSIATRSAHSPKKPGIWGSGS